MKKLIFIAIVIMSVSFVSNTFGQAADWEIKPMVKKPKTTIIKPATTERIRKPKKQGARDLESQSAGTERRKNSKTSSNSSRTQNPKAITDTDSWDIPIAIKKPRKTSIFQDTAQESGIRRKQPRKRITQKRTYKP